MIEPPRAVHIATGTPNNQIGSQFPITSAVTNPRVGRRSMVMPVITAVPTMPVITLPKPFHGLLDLLDPAPRVLAAELHHTPWLRQAIKMKIWRVLLRLSVSLHDHGEIQAIDTTGFGRRGVTTGNASDTTPRPLKFLFSWTAKPT